MFKIKRTLLPILMIIMLSAQMMNPVPVLADGGTHPPAAEETPVPDEATATSETPVSEEETSTSETEDATPAEETSTSETEDAAPAEETSTSETEDATPTEETPTPDETTITPEATDSATEVSSAISEDEMAPEPETEEDMTVAEALEQAPEETEIVVVNAEGEVEPLATQEAAEIVAEADPIWCPDGTDPTAANAGGTCSPSYTTMTDLINWLTTNNPNVAGTIWIEKTYDSAAEGVAGFTLDGAVLTNMSNYSLTIQGGWNGLGTNTVDTTSPSTFAGDYLHIINWNAKVTLNDIAVDGAADDGIIIETTGDVNLTNITTNKNDGDGLYVNTDGSFTLSGTNTFNENVSDGLDVNINNGGALTIKNGTTTTSGNGDNGIEILTNGAVTLTDITANANDNSGLYIWVYDAGALTVTNSTLGDSVANGNGNDGMEVFTDGSVTLKNIAAIGNYDNGVKVYADYGDGDLIVSDSTFSQNGDEGLEGETDTGTIKLTNIFANQNAQIGLLLTAYNGDIFLENATANNNGQEGAFLDTCDWDGFCYGSGSVTLTGSNFFNQNSFDGLYVESGGNITGDNIEANENDLFGIWLDAYGDTILNNITANTNGLGGAVLQTEFGNINVFTGQFNDNGADAEPDCINGSCEFDIYDSAESTGLAIGSWEGAGQIVLKNVQASRNYGDGAVLFGDDVLVYNSIFNNNGMYIFEPGVDDLYANGLYIEEVTGSSAAYLECVQADNNAAYGVEIYTGDITLGGVTAIDNLWDNFNLESDTLQILSDPCSERIEETDNTNINPAPSLPWHVVNVQGNAVLLTCEQYRGTKLVLPNDDFVYIPCPIKDSANLSSQISTNLLGTQPEGKTFRSALKIQVTQDGNLKPTLESYITVSYIIPADVDVTSLVILFWDGSKWVELNNNLDLGEGRFVGQGGFVSPEGTHFQATVNFTGDFMLVSQ